MTINQEVLGYVEVSGSQRVPMAGRSDGSSNVIQGTLTFIDDTGDTLVDLTSAVTMAAIFGGSLPTGTKFVSLYADAAYVYRSGGTPTATVGIIAPGSTNDWFDQTDLANVKLIAVTGTVHIFAEAFK